MNLLTFELKDLDPSGMLSVCGRRARHMLDIHKVQPGSRLKVGALGSGIGQATVVAVESETVVLQVGPLTPANPSPSVELILALPRPQTVKKVLELCASLGLRHIYLIGSERVERSYFRSPVLLPESIQEHLRLGMEQGVSTLLPEVSIHPRFTQFLTSELPSLSDAGLTGAGEPSASRRLVAEPGAEHTLRDLFSAAPLECREPVVIAVGPEAGWRERELALFAERGFQPFSLGESILRVEYAVAFLLGQIGVLRTEHRIGRFSESGEGTDGKQ